MLPIPQLAATIHRDSAIMAPSSFRCDERLRPARYRTPSPPPCESAALVASPSVAPSEVTGDWRLDRVPQHHASKGSQPTYGHRHSRSTGSGLEVFASIALAANGPPSHLESGTSTQNHSELANERAEEEGRPFKRPKTSGHETNGYSSGGTSSTPAPARPSDAEAELLLNFAREVQQEHQRSTSITASEKFLSPTFSSRSANAPYASVFDDSPRQAEVKGRFDSYQTQEQAPNGAHNGNQSADGMKMNTLSSDELEEPEEMALITHPADLLPDSTIEQPTAEPSAEANQESSAAVPNAQQSDATVVEENGLADGSSQDPLAKETFPSSLEDTTKLTSAPVNSLLEGIEDATNESAPQEQPQVEIRVLSPGIAKTKTAKRAQPEICAHCNFTPDSLHMENMENAEAVTSWIKCDGCEDWFHFACAGFRTEREVRSVDKFRCKSCEKTHGVKTSYVRKSNRTHNQIDYAGLHEGVLKTSEDCPEHHYVKHFKEGKKWVKPHNFPRLRPEEVTAEAFQDLEGWKNPIVIPAEWNPRPLESMNSPVSGNVEINRPSNPEAETVDEVKPNSPSMADHETKADDIAKTIGDAVANHQALVNVEAQTADEAKAAEGAPVTGEMKIADETDTQRETAIPIETAKPPEPEQAPENGPDALGMVMPKNLTVRRVAELYGQDEKVDVIDVKSQNGEDKRWNLKRWVDYYENPGKIIRNVISLEVSHSELGRLVQRPQIVRDLDLQDHVWPKELKEKGEWPKVQMYCLMSVADCFTDFHIDFGGSSVFYHILRGKKTFFFIPPYEKHLKKYEEWCNSPAQNWTFLGEQTKECYRVDLSEGDTALIPAGWIHAVWTPEASLVIGGNFLSPMHYHLQIRVAQIEKVTKVAPKFRYPHFQKINWFAALHYLDTDPLPNSVRDLLAGGNVFPRERATHESSKENARASEVTPEYRHNRFYSKTELDGLSPLCAYLLRTVYVVMGCINENIPVETQKRVKRSIPKGHKHGEPLDVVKKFAMWSAWKRGNEPIPEWAYPDFVPEATAPKFNEKKISARMQKKLEREVERQAFQVAPERQSMRARAQPQTLLAELTAKSDIAEQVSKAGSPALENTIAKKRKSDGEAVQTPKRKRPSTGDQKETPPRGKACEACRRARKACKHRDLPQPISMPNMAVSVEVLQPSAAKTPTTTEVKDESSTNISPPTVSPNARSLLRVEVPVIQPSQLPGHPDRSTTPMPLSDGATQIGSSPASKSSRGKACEICRRSKVGHFRYAFGSSANLVSVAVSMMTTATRIQPKRLKPRCRGLPLGSVDRLIRQARLRRRRLGLRAHLCRQRKRILLQAQNQCRMGSPYITIPRETWFQKPTLQKTILNLL